jgi:hypothetical protein
MKKMKELCIKAKLELGQADGNDLASLANKNQGDSSILGSSDDSNDQTEAEAEVIFYELEGQSLTANGI